MITINLETWQPCVIIQSYYNITGYIPYAVYFIPVTSVFLTGSLYLLFPCATHPPALFPLATIRSLTWSYKVLGQCSLKCGSWTSRINITWRLINGDPQTSLQPVESETLDGTQQLPTYQSLQGILRHGKV